jgi:hypothetical protein
MRLIVSCEQCQSDPATVKDALFIAEYVEGMQYKYFCPLGHRTDAVLQQQKFEVLFEIGAYAIIDGYYREAIVSFTASLERFYKFFIGASCKHRGVSDDALDAAFGLLKRSEPQLGAFVVLHLLELQQVPSLLSNKLKEQRNKVVHDGLIPTREEAMRYGQSVLDIIRGIILQLHQDPQPGTLHPMRGAMRRLWFADSQKEVAKAKVAGVELQPVFRTTIIGYNPMSALPSNKPLDREIVRLRNELDNLRPGTATAATS